MRLLHIIPTLGPESGGPAEAVRLFVQFAPEHVQSEIVTMDDPAAPFLAAFACPVHALGVGRGTFGYNAKLLPWLRANRSRYDGVVVHALWGYVGNAARRALYGCVLYAVFAHGMLDPYFKHAFPAKHAKKWLYWLLSEYWTLRRAKRVLFTTQVEADLAKQSFWLHRWEPMIVPLGTTPLPPATDADREAFLAQCPAARGRRFLLFMGRIHPKKGVDLLVQAFLTAARDPELDLVIAGPPSHEHADWITTLQHLAEQAGVASRIHWPGMITGASKRGALELCEAFILPSHQENFGIAVVEALAAARPVLISDKVNIAPEIAADGCGFVEPDTLAGTEALLARWQGLSPQDRNGMRPTALAAFQTHYDMRANAALLAEAFRA